MIVLLFGKPRAGKSTIVARFVEKNRRKRDRYYKWVNRSKVYPIVQDGLSEGNVICKMTNKLLYKKKFYDVVYATDETIKNTVYISYEDLGKWKPYPNSCLILEEAGIGLSNYDWKGLSSYSKRLSAIHGHLFCDIILLSQTVDVSKPYRQRAQVMFLVEKTLIPGVTSMRRILYSVDVDENTHDLVDAYTKHKGLGYLIEKIFSVLRYKHRNAKTPFLRSQWIYRPFWYKYFDSYEDNFTYPMNDPMESDFDKWLYSGKKNPFYEHLRLKRNIESADEEVEKEEKENDIQGEE